MIWKPDDVSAEEIKEVYQHIQERHGVYLRNGHDRRRAVNFVVDYVSGSEKPILDMGTGQGLAAVELARQGNHVATIDISEENLRRSFLYAASESLEDMIEFYLENAEDLPFGEDDFDSVLMMNMLHHLSDFRAVAAELSRVIAPGGVLVIADFTEKGFEILDSIHRIEGREHTRENRMMLSETREILWDFGLQCRQQDSRFEEHLMVASRI